MAKPVKGVITLLLLSCSFSKGLAASGTVVAWGNNAYGQTNPPSGLTNITAVATGRSHCLALKSDGTVVTWGTIRVGIIDYPQVAVPADLGVVVAIAAGQEHSVALRANGTV